MSDADAALPELLKDEGSQLEADDHGRGPSRYGITFATYQQFFPAADADDIVNMTAAGAEAFYREWWDKYHFGLITDQALASKVFNMSVNIGPDPAISILQETANSLYNQTPLPVDSARAGNSCPRECLSF